MLKTREEGMTLTIITMIGSRQAGSLKQQAAHFQTPLAHALKFYYDKTNRILKLRLYTTVGQLLKSRK